MFNRIRAAIFDRQRRKWEKKRKRGKRFFILYRGVARWGGIMFVLTMITSLLVRREKLDWPFVTSLLIACLFAGYIWARATWFLNERRFSGVRKQPDLIKES